MWLFRRRSDEDFAEEIHAHIAFETKRLVEDEGLSFTDARAQALRSFGNVARAQERYFEGRRLAWLEDLRRDVAYGFRNLRRNPGFAVVAILTLSLGIGATTTIYSVVDAILLKPLPFAQSDRLVRVVENEAGGLSGRIFQRGMPYQQFVEWRARTTTLEDVVAYAAAGPTVVRTDDGPKRLWGARTSANTFAMLGAKAMMGRTLDRTDENNPNVVVLGFEAWRRLFRSDPAIVGKQLALEGAPAPPLTVVGVLPPRFEFPTGAMDFYRPFDPSRPSGGQMIGRLRTGVPLQAAMDEAAVIGTSLRPPRRADAPPLPVPRFEVQRLKDEIVKDLRPALRVLLAAAAVVLLIVCANMAHLLLARGTARQREMAVRAAIGAGRGRLIRQVLTECLTLAIAGGALGALLAAAGVALVKHLATIDVPGIFRLMFGTTILPRGHEVGVDLYVFFTAFGTAACACVLFGLLPALHLSRTNHVQAMAARSGTARRGEARLRSLLVIGQLMMATVLLVGAGLLINSFVKLSTVDKGYDASNVLAVQLLFPGNYPIARKAETIDALLNRLRSHPNVRSAGFSRAGVLIGEEITYGTFVPNGRSLEEMRRLVDKPRVRSISEGFLPAMGIRFVSGRDLTAADVQSAVPAIVMNRRAAATLFATRNPVGEIVEWHFDKFHVAVKVVGVVDELRNESLDQNPFPEVFVDYRQLWAVVQRLALPLPQQDQTALGLLSFAVRTKNDPDSMIPIVTGIVRAVDANAGIDAVIPLGRLVDSSITRQRFYAVMLSVFAIIAALLAAVGIYGVLAYAVVQRTQEIGIRMALGAERRAVLALVLRTGLTVTAIGIGLGLIGAFAATRLLESMLFGVTPADGTTFVAVSVIFSVVAACASYVPARRATTVNPVVALRAE